MRAALEIPRDPVVTAPRTASSEGRIRFAGRGIARNEVLVAVDGGVTGGVDRTDGREDALVSANAVNTPVLAKNKFMPTAPCTWCKTVRYSPRHLRALQAGGGRPDSQYIRLWSIHQRGRARKGSVHYKYARAAGSLLRSSQHFAWRVELANAQPRFGRKNSQISLRLANCPM